QTQKLEERDSSHPNYRAETREKHLVRKLLRPRAAALRSLSNTPLALRQSSEKTGEPHDSDRAPFGDGTINWHNRSPQLRWPCLYTRSAPSPVKLRLLWPALYAPARACVACVTAAPARREAATIAASTISASVAPALRALPLWISMQYGHCVVRATATAISSLYFTGIAPSATAALSNAQKAFITSGARASIFFSLVRFCLVYVVSVSV